MVRFQKRRRPGTCLGQPEGDPIAWARDSRREIHTKYGGVLKVYSSDADSKHGYSFSAILIDELHAQPNRRLWDVLTVGSDAARRQQVVIVLTTAGDDPDRKSIGWEIHEKCRRILAWRKGEPERELDEDDPQWCPIMYGISVLTQDDPDRIVELDEERKAAMVSNLLVVLCADEAAQPIVNAGTLHH